MTPQQHCDHECTCRHHFPSDYAAIIPCKDTCKYDTRSRPHTSSTGTDPRSDYVCGLNDGQISILRNLPEHDTAIRNEERNATLDEVEKEIYKMAKGRDSGEIPTAWIIHKLESLRTKEQPTSEANER